MADKKISQLTNITGANLADDDEFVVVDTSVDETKAITWSELKEGLDTGTGFVRITGDTMTGDLTVPNLITSGDVDGRDVSADGTKLDGIEANADVTDTANVTSAGALMDSELTNITAVKALDQGVATTDDPTFTNTQLAAIAASKAVTAVDVFVYDTSKDSDGGAWRKRTQHTSWYNETLNTATRGSRREFPAVAVIVAEANKVTIYDGDDPALPMWMVFETDLGDIFRVAGGSTKTSVAALNGAVVVGDSTFDVQVAIFPSDTARRYGTFGISTEYLGNIEQRNDGLGHGGATTPNIVNRAVNDVAMTVLPDAPIDPATGLPVPTIAVATAGGVSVIKDDGTVVDSLSTNVFEKISISSDNYLYGLDTTFAEDVQTFDYIGDLAEGFFANAIHWEQTPSGVKLSDDVMNNLEVLPGGFCTAAQGQRPALNVVHENRDTPTEGMVNYITSSFQSGYQVGDIKGAFLADTDDTDLVASGELVTNGTFDTDTNWTKETGWTIGAGVASYDGTGSQYNKLSQTLSGLVVGKVYALTFTVSGLSGDGTLNFGFGNSAGTGFVSPQQTYSVDGTYTRYMTASVVDHSIIVQSNVATQTITIDNISVKLADADRSVNARGLVVNGNVTRSPVATGAELVAYSGFSASNYLEQPYNPDLDFGTGDFCVMGWVELNSTGYGGIFHLSAEKTSTSNPGFCLYYFPTGIGFKVGAQTAQSAVRPSGKTYVCGVRSGTTLLLYLNGSLVGTYPNATNSATPSPGASLLVGGYYQTGVPIVASSNDKFALLRISATAPTADQIRRIYEDEKVLFQENAAATLYGASDAVTALAHDSDTGLLHVGTSAGRSVFQGLRRVSNTTTAVGTAISASNGLVVEE